MQKVFRLLALAWCLGLFPSMASANPTTPKKELVYEGTTLPAAPLVIKGEGYARIIIQFDEPGATKSYDYSLTSRTCVSTSSCSEWSNTALASGTLSGTNDLEIAVSIPRDQYQLTLSNLVNAAVIRIWALKN